MTTIDGPGGGGSARRAAVPTLWAELFPAERDRQAALAVGLYALTLFVFPVDLVLRVVGGQGFVAGLVAFGLLAGWLTSSLVGGHDPLRARHPTRAAVAYFAIMSLICWALMPFHGLSHTQQLGGDRWIMMTAQFAGVVLIAAEGLTTVQSLLTVLRMTVRGAAFCSFVAIMQWVLAFDLSAYIRQAVPGFTVDDSSFSVYSARGSLQRVTGTAMHPIELGVVAGMMLPIAVAVAMHDRGRSGLVRWLPIVLIGLAIPASVSRSGVLAIMISAVVLVLALPARPRVTALLMLPIGAFVLAIARPGYLRTLAAFVGAGSDDSSVSTRLSDYPTVERLVSKHPWFGIGGGTYMPDNLIDVLDNQYLKTAIEMGLLGMTGFLVWLVVPVLTALGARRRSSDPVLRTMAGALCGAALANVVCSFTFDALTFNMFGGVQSLVAGLCGACWVLASREARSAPAAAVTVHEGS